MLERLNYHHSCSSIRKEEHDCEAHQQNEKGGFSQDTRACFYCWSMKLRLDCLIQDSIPILRNCGVLPHALVVISNLVVLFTFIVLDYEPIQEINVILGLKVNIQAFINVYSIKGIAIA